MARVRAGFKLFREFVGFARAHKVYYIVPLIMILVIVSFVIVASQSAAPLLYTLF